MYEILTVQWEPASIMEWLKHNQYYPLRIYLHNKKTVTV